MRYWLRAALGGVIGDKNLEGLHKLESAVFGSTDHGSPIQIRLQGDHLQSSNEKILPHKNAGSRQAFIARQPIKLTMAQLRSNEETIWQAACSALNLALTFGGVGLRSRRGHGTLRIVQSSDLALAPLTPTTIGSWKQHLQLVVEKAVDSARNLATAQKVNCVSLPQSEARYPCATQKGLIRLCSPQAPSASSAVRQFMEHASGDYAFGGVKPRRQASPLWVRPIQFGEQYGLLLIVLASDFHGANYETVRGFLDKEFPGEDIRMKGWNA
jgi:CRISPR-associated protein Cmr1